MNIANKITIGRIFFTMIFIALALLGKEQWRWLAFIIGIIAGISDFFDGYLARKYNLITDFGILIDPLADKIFITSACIVLLYDNFAPVILVLVILIREFAVTGLRLIAVQKQTVIDANIGGKIKTCVQYIYLAWLGSVWAGFLPHTFILDILMYVTILITTYTGIEYFIKYSKLYMTNL